MANGVANSQVMVLLNANFPQIVKHVMTEYGGVQAHGFIKKLLYASQNF